MLTLIDFTRGNPREESIPQPPQQASNKLNHTDQPIPFQPLSNLPSSVSISVAQNTAITAAINETISRLKALETTNTNTTSSINDISTHLNTQGTSIEQQSTKIKALG